MRFPLSWWQTLWVLLLISGLVFRARSAAEISQDPVDALALFRIGLVCLVALVLFLRLTLRKTRWSPGVFSGIIGVFLLYPLISLASTVWSVSPAWTLYKSVEFFIDVLLLAAIVSTLESAEEYKKFVNLTWVLLGFLVATAWIGAVVDPGDALFSDPSVGLMALPARLVGVMPVVSCNELSQISAILGLVALSRLFVDPEAQNKKARYWSLFFISLVTLIITQTRGAFAAFFIGLVVLLILTRRYRLAGVAGVSSALVIGALLLFTNFGASAGNFLLRGQSLDQASGISGRGEIWQDAFSKIMDHPLIGYGGFAGARFVIVAKNSSNSSALNSYIDGALNIGLAGPIILFLVVFFVGWMLFKSINRQQLSTVDSSLALEIFIAFIIIGISSFESSNLVIHPPIAFLTILGAAKVLHQERRSFAAKGLDGLNPAVMGGV